MKTMKIYAITFMMLAAFSLASCSSDLQWADPEVHEKAEQLREQYGCATSCNRYHRHRHHRHWKSLA